MTPQRMAEHIAKQMRAKRLALNFSQKSLAERSGVSFGVLKKFERTGKISLESLLKLAVILDAFEEFKELFKKADPESFVSIDELMKSKRATMSFKNQSVVPAGEHSTLSHLLRLAEMSGIKKANALQIIDQVKAAVAKWKEYAKEAGVSATSFKMIQKRLLDITSV